MSYSVWLSDVEDSVATVELIDWLPAMGDGHYRFLCGWGTDRVSGEEEQDGRPCEKVRRDSQVVRCLDTDRGQ